jgi:hypothetical protein
MLDGIFVELTSIIGIVTRIQIDSQKDFVGNSGMLFTVINQPQAYSPGRAELKKMGQTSLALSLLLGVLLTLGQIFFRRIFRKGDA